MDRKLLYVTSKISSTLKFCDYRASLSGNLLLYQRMYKWKLPHCLASDLENRTLCGQSWNWKFFQTVLWLSLRATDHDCGAKYSPESTTVYLTLGASAADLLLTLVSNTSLDSGQDPFIWSQHKHFITDSGNDEEINVKNNVSKEDINGVLMYLTLFPE